MSAVHRHRRREGRLSPTAVESVPGRHSAWLPWQARRRSASSWRASVRATTRAPRAAAAGPTHSDAPLPDRRSCASWCSRFPPGRELGAACGAVCPGRDAAAAADRRGDTRPAAREEFHAHRCNERVRAAPPTSEGTGYRPRAAARDAYAIDARSGAAGRESSRSGDAVDGREAIDRRGKGLGRNPRPVDDVALLARGRPAAGD
jgi:hypothetical protein